MLRRMAWLLKFLGSTERRLALLAVAVGVGLLGLKFTAYAITGSAAIFSDALESIINVLASLVALYSLNYAARPADESHPYGHGKIEFISAGFEGGMITLAAAAIAFRTIDILLFHEIRIEAVGLGLVLMVIAMCVNGGVGLALVRTGRKLHSITLEADGRHLLTDAVTTVGVLVALGVVQLTGWVWADPIAALLIAVYIALTGLSLLRRSYEGLMDKQDLADDRLIAGILDAHVGPAGREPRICSYHKLRHRHSGRYHWVDFHLVVPPHISVDRGHAIASAIEYEIEQTIGEGNATAHIEPCREEGCCA